jgi:hypothetical protein
MSSSGELDPVGSSLGDEVLAGRMVVGALPPEANAVTPSAAMTAIAPSSATVRSVFLMAPPSVRVRIEPTEVRVTDRTPQR